MPNSILILIGGFIGGFSLCMIILESKISFYKKNNLTIYRIATMILPLVAGFMIAKGYFV